MKRIIAILLTVLLLGMLTACDQNVGRHADGIIKADKATFEIGKTHSSFEGTCSFLMLSRLRIMMEVTRRTVCSGLAMAVKRSLAGLMMAM